MSPLGPLNPWGPFSPASPWKHQIETHTQLFIDGSSYPFCNSIPLYFPPPHPPPSSNSLLECIRSRMRDSLSFQWRLWYQACLWSLSDPGGRTQHVSHDSEDIKHQHPLKYQVCDPRCKWYLPCFLQLPLVPGGPWDHVGPEKQADFVVKASSYWPQCLIHNSRNPHNMHN